MAIRSKRHGKSADFVAAIDQNSDMTIEVIGAKGDVILQFEEPSRHVLEQIIAKIGIPPWMLGMHWSTTERLSDVEAEMLLADVETRQSAKMPVFFNIVRNMLLLRKRTWRPGDWKLKWAQVNLRDILKQAQARFMNSQADMYDMQNKPTPAPKHSPARTKWSAIIGPAKVVPGCKETQRPNPWPALDKVEADYEKELKYEWGELKNRLFLILKLGAKSSKDPAISALLVLPMTSGL